MREEEIKIEKPDKIVKLVEEILKFNKQKQEGQGIKILTPSQMLSRLPISLAQLEAGNNSEELKNEIRQLLYSLYHSKNITKQVYNNLIKPIWIKNTIIIIVIIIISSRGSGSGSGSRSRSSSCSSSRSSSRSRSCSSSRSISSELTQ